MIDKYLLEGEKKADPDLEVEDSQESLPEKPIQEQRSRFKAALTRWLGAAGVALSALVASGCGNVDNHQESSAKTDTRDRTADLGKTEQALSSNPRFLGLDCKHPILNPDADEIACGKRSFQKYDIKIVKFAGKDYMNASFTVTTWTPPKPALSGEGFSTIFKRKGINNAIELFGIDYGGGGALVKWENNNWIDVHWDTNHAGPNSVAQFDNDTLVVGGDITAKIDIARIDLKNQTGVPYKLVPITGIDKILKEPVMFYPYRKLSEGFARTTLKTVHYVQETSPGTGIWNVKTPPFIPPKDAYSFDFKESGCWIVVGTWNTSLTGDVVIDQMPNCPAPPSENPATENTGGEPVAEGVDGGVNETAAEVSNEATAEVINDAADGGIRDQQDGAPDLNQADAGNKDNGGSDTFEPVTADGGNTDNEPAATDGPSTEKNIDGGGNDSADGGPQENKPEFAPEEGVMEKSVQDVNQNDRAVPENREPVRDAKESNTADKETTDRVDSLNCGDPILVGNIKVAAGENRADISCLQYGVGYKIVGEGAYMFKYPGETKWTEIVQTADSKGCAEGWIYTGDHVMRCGTFNVITNGRKMDSIAGDVAMVNGKKRIRGIITGVEGTEHTQELDKRNPENVVSSISSGKVHLRYVTEVDGQEIVVQIGTLTPGGTSIIRSNFAKLIKQAEDLARQQFSERPAPDIDPNKPGCGGCSTNPNEDGGNNTPSWPLAALGALGLAALRRRKAGRNREKKDGK